MIDGALEVALRSAAGRSTLLVASDYDGVLSPIVDDPSAAVSHPPAVEAMARISECGSVHAVIISGRSRDVLELLSGAPPSVTLVGNHGALAVDADTAATAKAVAVALSDLGRSFAGAVVEPKPLGAAFHYRHVESPEAAAAAARAIGEGHGAQIIEGKMVVEVVVGHGDKGSAIERMREQWSADAVVFFGDDVTDESVFITLGPDDVGVKVGPGATAARYRVADPEEVAGALEMLLGELRSLSR
ncbi:MAG: trehalose-phosphatase [Acidimicrobiia bacterium]